MPDFPVPGHIYIIVCLLLYCLLVDGVKIYRKSLHGSRKEKPEVVQQKMASCRCIEI